MDGGTAGEHTRDLDKHRNQAIEIIEMLQINVISRANHEDRLWKSLSQRLPGLLDLPELRIETFLGLEGVALRTLTSHTRWRRVGISYMGMNRPSRRSRA